MYPLGVETVGSILLTVRYVFKAYKEVRQANKKYEAAKKILESLDFVLRKLEALTVDNILEHEAVTFVEGGRDAWNDLEKYLEGYERDLAIGKTGRRITRQYAKMHWAIDVLDKKIDDFHNHIEKCFIVIQHTLQIDM